MQAHHRNFPSQSVQLSWRSVNTVTGLFDNWNAQSFLKAFIKESTSCSPFEYRSSVSKVNFLMLNIVCIWPSDFVRKSTAIMAPFQTSFSKEDNWLKSEKVGTIAAFSLGFNNPKTKFISFVYDNFTLWYMSQCRRGKTSANPQWNDVNIQHLVGYYHRSI